MYNNRFNIVDENLYLTIKSEVKNMDFFFRKNLKRHPAEIFDMSKRHYKESVLHPNPLFFKKMYIKYITMKSDIYYTMFYDFFTSSKYALPYPHNIAKPKFK